MEALISEDDEEWLRATPPAAKKKKKVITLDDILEADYKESVRKQKPTSSSKRLQQVSKLKSHLYSSSSDDDIREEDRQAPRQMLDELEKQVASGVGKEVEPEWGLPVLGVSDRETVPPGVA